MKRLACLVFCIGLVFGFLIGLYDGIKTSLSINFDYYDYFEGEELVGIDREINLTYINNTRDDLYNEITTLFKQEDFNYDSYIQIISDKENNNSNLTSEINNLSNQIISLQDKTSNLKEEYKVLNNKYNTLKVRSVQIVSNSYNFPLINQYPSYPTGCESVALTMLLRYYGVSVTADMVISRLKKVGVPQYENGILYGGNPEVEFIGNPYTSASYGVYEKPIAEVANNFKAGVIAKSGVPFSEVIGIVQSGKPVMVWASMNMAAPYISKTWIYKPTGETIGWKANEHAMVIVDVKDNNVIVADPIGGSLKSFSISLFEQRYNYYGKKVIYYG